MSSVPRVIVGISGASGAAVGVRIVELLAARDACEIHLVATRAAERTILHEVGDDALARAASLAHHYHHIDDVGACIASGSFRALGMIVAPCSIRTMSAVASGNLDTLLTRAADVQLKERRKLVLMLRESPLHLGHIRSMQAVTEYGAIIAPLAPAFYLKPQSVAEIIEHMAQRAIGLLGVDDLAAPSPEWSNDTPPTCPRH